MGHFRAKSLLAVLFASPILHAQTSTAPRFDVVSVKLSVPGADPLKHGLLRVTTPDRVRYLGINLKALMMTAYGLEEYQVVAPDWMGMTDVDIEATMSVGTTAAQLRVMFQNLLLDRFKLTFHWDTSVSGVAHSPNKSSTHICALGEKSGTASSVHAALSVSRFLGIERALGQSRLSPIFRTLRCFEGERRRKRND